MSGKNWKTDGDVKQDIYLLKFRTITTDVASFLIKSKSFLVYHF